jgi:hypothetical protein
MEWVPQVPSCARLGGDYGYSFMDMKDESN